MQLCEGLLCPVFSFFFPLLVVVVIAVVVAVIICHFLAIIGDVSVLWCFVFPQLHILRFLLIFFSFYLWSDASSFLVSACQDIMLQQLLPPRVRPL